MDQYRSRLKLSENFERHWSILISGEIHMDQSLVHTFSLGKFAWTNGRESSSKVSPYTGICPWMAFPRYFLSSLRARMAKRLICTNSGVSADSRKSAKKRDKPHFLCKNPNPPILAFFVFLAFFVLRFSLLFCAFLLSFPRILRVRQK